MLEGLRSEFPELGRIRVALHRPALSREPLAWAFVSGQGAALVVSGILAVLLLPLDTLLFPATEPRPEWLRPGGLAQVAGALAAAAVVVRAGGLAALGAYVGFELLRILAALPARLEFCERSGLPSLGGSIAPLPGCDLGSMLVEQWPVWVAVAIGALGSSVLLPPPAPGPNLMLRGAGAFVLGASMFFMGAGLLLRVGTLDQQFMVNNLFTVVQVVAAVAAGYLVARARWAAAVLVAVLIAAVPLSVGLPLARTQGSPGVHPDALVERVRALAVGRRAAAHLRVPASTPHWNRLLARVQ